jgi:uncharacterized membrane protein
MTIFYFALVSAVVASVAAGVLAARLAKALPSLHQSVETPLATEWWPFWVFHFFIPSKWRQLPANLKPLAFVAMSGVAIAVSIFLYKMVHFAASGGSL